ncbi:MAG: glycolate oxidase iron-sulfur subunit, partial [Betaproteobacteria bacterium]|nr:glycolate oxidase iron-sulfur subunit [Betaproteobacteria bacterium]
METHLASWMKATPDGDLAESILRRCVHCGFCTATCPTYQLLGDERDGPRGRIYLIKQVLEGEPASRATQTHLDRCLSCRNCESTCPSGVDYGHLLDVGRKVVEQQVSRPLSQRLLRGVLRETLTRGWLFGPAMRLGQRLRSVLPMALRAKVPAYRGPGLLPTPLQLAEHRRQVLLLVGCVQPAMMPSIDAATIRVLHRLGIRAEAATGAGCCGAIRHHLADESGALMQARRNIDAWWPQLEQSEVLLINASGCSLMVKEYGHLLRNDPAYAERARLVSDKTQDISAWLTGELQGYISRQNNWTTVQQSIAFHPPCTLQHGQQIRGQVESLLQAFGVKVLPIQDSHLCCGSAGTYSITQADLSLALRDRKLQHLQAAAPDSILSANIGCISHLQAGTELPVRHWIEWVDA